MKVTIEFIEAVKEMRKAQREFFSNRSNAALGRSRKLEREVDAMLAQIERLRPAEPKEGRLF